MNTLVKARIRRNPPLVEVTLTPGKHPRLFTRIWMSVFAPQLEEPAYAVVVGEAYDGDDRQKSRVKMILDEGTCLSPDDLEKAGKNPQEYYDLLYTVLNDGQVVPKSQMPVMEDIRGVAVALKDLYRPSRCLVAGSKQNEPFYNWLRQTHGLMAPSPGADAAKNRKLFPFFVHESVLCPVINETPFWQDNEDYASNLVSALISRGELQWWKDLPLWNSPFLKNPRKAVGMICAAMSLSEWQHFAEQMEPSDGYGEMEDEDKRERQLKKLRRKSNENFWMLS